MSKLFPVASVLTLAAVAQADFFFIATQGEFAAAGDPLVGSLETTVDTQFGPYAFESVEGDFSAELGDPGDPGAFEGTFELIGPDDGEDSVLTIAASGMVDNGGGMDFFSYSGLWEVIGATGVYEGLTGSGDFSGSHFFEDAEGGFASLKIQGILVPAPAAGMVLGLGLFVTARRRR